MRTESQASLHSCHNVDADAWCKWALNTCPHLNKKEFQPLSQILFVRGTLGCWSPLWNQIHQETGPVHK